MENRSLEDRELAERHLFIIARDQASLWEYLRREFASETNVEVILDRRLGRDRRSAFDRLRDAPDSLIRGSTALGLSRAAQPGPLSQSVTGQEEFTGHLE